MDAKELKMGNFPEKRNATRREYPFETPLIRFIEEQVEKTPDLPALIFGNETLSYRQLNTKANQLANYLVSLGVSPDTMVGICIERSIEMVVGILGIVKAGGAYVPFDPEYPFERLSYMVNDSNISILLTQNHLTNKILKKDIKVLCLDTDWDKIENSSPDNPDVSLKADNLIYMIYTSGSTGNPKGVPNIHRALVNRIFWMQDEYQLTSRDRVLQKTPFSFDVSVWEFFWPLMTGACLVVAKPGGHKDPEYLVDTIIKYNITTLHFVPSMLSLFLTAERISKITSIRQVFCSGEALPFELTKRFFSKLDTKLHNLYGPTEAAVDVTYWECLKDSKKNIVPIGFPIANIQIHMLDKELKPVPDGEIGELHIGGVGLARGYWNRPELTAEKFIRDPFGQSDTDRLYKTGDLARYLPDGSIEYLGRVDFQVKIRGFRIELGEIEAVLMKHETVLEATVIDTDETLGEKKLLAYLVLDKRRQLSVNDLREFLLKELPEFMVPAAFIFLDQMPLSPNGKVDRKALPKGKLKRPDLDQMYIAPKSNLEKKLCRIWSELLNLDRVGINDNFFDLGGNSLLGMMTVVLLEEQEKITLPIVKLFQYSTVKTLAAFLESNQTDQKASEKIVDRMRSFSDRKNHLEHNGIAIIGMSGRFPGAYDVDQLWEVLAQGKETVTFFSKEELGPGLDPEITNDPNYVYARGIIPDGDKFDASFFGINPAEAKVMDPQQRVFLELAWAALENAGYTSEQYEGLIGVYGGMGNNYYLTLNAATHPDLIRMVGLFPVMVGNEKDHLALRTAHKLNLTGPAVSVHTACSTAMIAIDNAFFSLNTFQCDMALAGGISLQTPQYSGQLHEPGGVFSSDGHCRPFDAAADGTMFSDSAGIIVMKRLDDAIRDRDTIYAVIKSTAVNNDGAEKISYLAPSIEGQKQVVLTALARAGISADTISYIEAHGTGTPIGDPIEVEALTQVFRRDTERNQFCGIGSIKSNLGHPTIAAGVAGVIKVALSLKNEKMPATVHYSKPNPRIDFENSPFYVVSHLTDWNRRNGVRRAGVSAFGFGGTNGHAILEEAPVQDPSGGSRPRNLIFLSSKTNAALDRMTDNLAHYFEKHNDTNVADAAYTLQSGRSSFNYRRFIVCGDSVDAAEKLKNLDPKSSGTRFIETKEPEVVFMFPGQGSQYVNMGLSFYQSQFDPVFKETVDTCAQILLPHIQCDIRDLLYPTGDVSIAEITLQNTKYQQPALFVLEYALAKLWQSWGIIPDAMIGHSIGEFVCAAISGVFKLEDVLRLVAARGRMMSELPGGAMLSVRLSAVEVNTKLIPGVSIAAINGPSLCVVSGPHDKIDDFKIRLESEGVASKILHTSHAFHSDMMEPIVERFAELVAKIDRTAPQIPIMSTVTAKWVTKNEFIDPMYWARQLRMPVRFAEVIEKIWEDPERVLLEVGPREVATTLARQQIRDRNKQMAISSLSDRAEDNVEWDAILSALGRLWLAGVKIDFKKFWHEEKRNKIKLPTYPFERKRFWLDPASDHFQVRSDSPTSGHTPLLNEFDQVDAVSNPAESSSVKDGMAKRITAILGEISGIEMGDDVDESMTFSEMGLDSLFLTQVIFSLEKKFGVKVTFRQLMEDYSSISRLSKYIEEKSEADREIMPPSPYLFEDARPSRAVHVTDKNIVTIHTTKFQQTILKLIQRDGNDASLSFNESIVVSLQGSVNIEAIRYAINMLCNRHEALRCVFADDGLTMDIHPTTALDVAFLDLSTVPKDALSQEVDKILKRNFSQIFNLTAGPIFRAHILKVEEEFHLVVLTSHLSVCDGWSLDVMVRELGIFYSTAVKSEIPGVQEPPGFKNYIEAQDQFRLSKSYGEMRSFWLDKFSSSIPSLALPTKSDNIPIRSYKGATVNLKVEAELVQKIKKTGGKLGCSFFTILLSAFNLLLFNLTGKRQFIIGMPIADQSTTNKEYLVGNCLNYLPLICKFDIDETLKNHILNLRGVVLDAIENSKYDFAEVNEIWPYQSEFQKVPFIQMCLNMSPKMESEKLKYRNLSVAYHVAPRFYESFDLFVNAITDQNDKLLLQYQYNDSKFSSAQIRQWHSVLEALLIKIAKSIDNAIHDYTMDEEIVRSNEQKFLGGTDYSTEVETIKNILKKDKIDLREIHNQAADRSSALTLNQVQDCKKHKQHGTIPVGDTPVFFGESDQLFGVFHIPKKLKSNEGVLFCYPIGQEYMRSHWAFKLLSIFLVQQGIPVFKFDYFGTGDSLGGAEDWDINTWSNNIMTAANELKQRADVTNVSIVALRFGAMLAASSIDIGLDVNKLIFWDPVVVGRQYLEELKSIHENSTKRQKNMFPFPTDRDLDLDPNEIIGFYYKPTLQDVISKMNLYDFKISNCQELYVVASENDKKYKILVERMQEKTVNLNVVSDIGSWNNERSYEEALLPSKILKTITSLLSGESS